MWFVLAAVFLLATVSGSHVLRLKFLERFQLCIVSLAGFAVFLNLGQFPDAGNLTGWMGVAVVLQLVGVRMTELYRRRAFAHEESIR